MVSMSALFVRTLLRAPSLRSSCYSGRRYLSQQEPAASSATFPTSADEIVVEKLSGEHAGIAVLGFNRPRAKNAIGRVFLKQLEATLDCLKYDDSLRVLIVRSLVPGVFCAGADLKERAAMPVREVGPFVARLRGATVALDDIPVPTIAAMDGAALGGGLEFALSCDLRVASNSAKMGLVETTLAIIPGAGGTQRLPRVVGRAKAKELIFTGRVLDGEQAEEIGLVNYVVEQNKEGDAAFQRALKLAEEIRPQGPIALRMAKLAINKGMDVPISNGLDYERAYYVQVTQSKDRVEGLTAFKEKRKPNYIGE
uniref:Putative enoyl-coa hydratase n=1 Tax=Amblyomma triste TaxID=251400 RepID=A0A023GKJ9_AMBTT